MDDRYTLTYIAIPIPGYSHRILQWWVKLSKFANCYEFTVL